MITNSMVRQCASIHGMSIRQHEGEWRITPKELSGSKAENVAYYTDDNDDAYMSIVAMRRTQDGINQGVK